MTTNPIITMRAPRPDFVLEVAGTLYSANAICEIYDVLPDDVISLKREGCDVCGFIG